MPFSFYNDPFMALILIVEDNEMNADMLGRRLVRAGHEVLVGTDGQTGVNMTREHRPDLVLMDMSLPVMDGWAAVRAIKADESISHIPVMALTAHAIVGERDKALAAGCDEYETKPVQWSRLQHKIAALLAATSGARTSADQHRALATAEERS
jgi:two-component system, cell cycle response regulator DivK